MKLFVIRFLSIAILFSLFNMEKTWAVGSAGYELGTNNARSLGKANAVVADPENASTIADNPAGLTKLDGMQMSTSTTLIVPQFHYEGANGGIDEDASLTVLPVPSIFISTATPVNKLKIGGGINSPFGLQTKYSSTGSLRYTGYFNEIKNVAYNLSSAYEAAPWLSVGGGVTYMDGSFKQVAKLNSNFISTASGVPSTTLADAPFELDVNGNGWGYDLGMLITPNEHHAIGVFYRSQIQIDYEGDLAVNNLQGAVMTAVFGGSSFNTSAASDITFPASITAGYKYSPNDKFDIELDATWTDWSSFDAIDIALGTTNAVLNQLEPVNEDINDTVSINIGISYDINPTWTATTGYFYYEMPANKQNFSNAIPDGSRSGFTFGVNFNKSKFSIDISYIGEIVSSIDIDNAVGSTNGATVDGEYSGLIHIISIGVNYKF